MMEPAPDPTPETTGREPGRRWRATTYGRWLTIDGRLGALIGLGLVSTLLYTLGITARYPLLAGLARPRVGWAGLANQSLRAGLVHAFVYVCLTVCYILALRLSLGMGLEQRRIGYVAIIGGWLLASIALLGAYPGESLDIFDYLFRGRMLAEFGSSPLAQAPVYLNKQLFYNYITWRGQVDTYGPLWEYASGSVAWLVQRVSGHSDSLAAYILGYRLLAVGAAGLCGLLIGALVGYRSPQHVPAALVAWFWNPLLLVATAVGAHNDILMVLAILAALLLLQRRYWSWGLLALALAAHVKLTALLILPVLWLWIMRRCGWWRTVRVSGIALAIGIPLSWLLYAPLGGWATLPRMLGERARLLVNSPADLVYRAIQEQWSWAESGAWRVTTLGATALFFVLAGAILVWFWWSIRPPMLGTDALLWGGCVAVTLAYLLVGSFWFQHWYLLWVLAPAALLPASRWTQTLLPTYCLGALWSNLANSFLLHASSTPFTATQVSAVNVLTQVLPLLSVVMVSLLWRHSAALMQRAIRHA